jgi:hypothetical protein
MPAAEFRFTSADCGCAFWIEKRTSAYASTRLRSTRVFGDNYPDRSASTILAGPERG